MRDPGVVDEILIQNEKQTNNNKKTSEGTGTCIKMNLHYLELCTLHSRLGNNLFGNTNLACISFKHHMPLKMRSPRYINMDIGAAGLYCVPHHTT